jgi:leucyl/phenylalanyl-tRNA--protein transferase
LIVHAYRQGIFPMGDEDGISWYSPDPRAVFPLDTFHVPKTLAKTIRQGKFEVRVDTAFEDVLRGCAGREETWITREIHEAYTGLFELGLAHSVEAWRAGELAGGLYGVALGGAFMGESMFSRQTDASKVCLVFLIERLRERGFILLDSQFPTAHLMRFGQTLIRRAEYLTQLKAALALDVHFN